MILVGPLLMQGETVKLKRNVELRPDVRGSQQIFVYPTCKDVQKKLGSTLELLQWKAQNSMIDSGFEKLLKIIKKQLPRGK